MGAAKERCFHHLASTGMPPAGHMTSCSLPTSLPSVPRTSVGCPAKVWALNNAGSRLMVPVATLQMFWRRNTNYPWNCSLLYKVLLWKDTVLRGYVGWFRNKEDSSLKVKANCNDTKRQKRTGQHGKPRNNARSFWKKSREAICSQEELEALCEWWHLNWDLNITRCKFLTDYP